MCNAPNEIMNCCSIKQKIHLWSGSCVSCENVAVLTVDRTDMEKEKNIYVLCRRMERVPEPPAAIHTIGSGVELN